MRSIHLTLGATLLLAAAAAVAGARDGEPWLRSWPEACTPEAQRCLEKLESRVGLQGGAHGGAGIERALLELQETDPECALLLRTATLTGF